MHAALTAEPPHCHDTLTATVHPHTSHCCADTVCHNAGRPPSEFVSFLRPVAWPLSMRCPSMVPHVQRLATFFVCAKPVERLRLRPSLIRRPRPLRALHFHSLAATAAAAATERAVGQSERVSHQTDSVGSSVLQDEDDDDADESAYDMPASSPAPPLSLSSVGPVRLDSTREWWEDNQIFGPPSNNPVLFERADKHKMLLALGLCQSLDVCIAIVRLILEPDTAALLTPHNYTFVLLTLHSHARPMLQQTAYHGASPQSSTLSADVSSVVCDVVEASFVHGWQLSSRSYACALHMIASLDDPRCLQLLSSVEACQDVIVSDGCYGAVMAYLQRQRKFAAVCQLWRSMQLRYERDRRQWDVPLQHFLTSHLLDDETQAELAALAVGAACQQLWMYHTAITAALRTRRVNTVLTIVQQLHSWQQRHSAIRAPFDGSASSVSALPSSSQPLFEHVNFRAAAVEPVWTALTFHSVLAVHAVAGEWWLVMLAINHMTAAGALLPLHRATVTRVAECAIQHRRWADLRALVSFVEQREPQLLSLELVALLTKRLEAAAHAHNGEDARLAAIESERMVRFCLGCLEQQRILRAFSAHGSGGDTQHSSSAVLSLVVEMSAAMPLPAVRRLVSLLLLSSEQRRRTGHSPTRLFLRCESTLTVSAITTQVRARGGSALILRQDEAATATISALLSEYNLLQPSSGGGNTPSFQPSHSSVTTSTPHAVLFVSAADRSQASMRDGLPAAPPAAAPVVALHDSSCSAGQLLRDVLQLREEARWSLVKRRLKRNRRRLAAASVEADAPFLNATLRCWAFRPPHSQQHQQPTTIAEVLQAVDRRERASPGTVTAEQVVQTAPPLSAFFPLTRPAFTNDLSTALQLCGDRDILRVLPSTATQSAASLVSLHERMSVLAVHCAVMLPLLQAQHRYQPLQRCADGAALPAVFVQSLDERLLHIAADFLHFGFGLRAQWLSPSLAADDCHSSAVALLTAARASAAASHLASTAASVLLVSRDAVCGWLLEGGRMNDSAWLERCLRAEEGGAGASKQPTKCTRRSGGRPRSVSAVGGTVTPPRGRDIVMPCSTTTVQWEHR